MSELAPLGSHPEPLSPGASQLRSSLLGGNGGWEREQSSLPTRMGGHSVSHLTSFQSASVMGSFATQLQRVTGAALPDWPDVSLAGQTTLANCSENHVLSTPSQMRSIKKFRDLWALMESRCGPQCQRGRESGEVMSGPGHGQAVLSQLSSGALQGTAVTWAQRAGGRSAVSLGSLVSLL